MALQGTTRAYSLLDNMAQHSQGVQPLTLHSGQHCMAQHGRALPQGCLYLPGCSTRGTSRARASSSSSPASLWWWQRWLCMVPRLCLHCCPMPTKPLLYSRGAEPPVKRHPWGRIALSSLWMHGGPVQGRHRELT